MVDRYVFICLHDDAEDCPADLSDLWDDPSVFDSQGIAGRGTSIGLVVE